MTTIERMKLEEFVDEMKAKEVEQEAWGQSSEDEDDEALLGIEVINEIEGFGSEYEVEPMESVVEENPLDLSDGHISVPSAVADINTRSPPYEKYTRISLHDIQILAEMPPQEEAPLPSVEAPASVAAPVEPTRPARPATELRKKVTIVAPTPQVDDSMRDKERQLSLDKAASLESTAQQVPEEVPPTPSTPSRQTFSRSVTIVKQGADLKSKLDSIVLENQDAIRRIMNQSELIYQSGPAPASKGTADDGDDTKLLVVREALSIKPALRSAISSRSIAEYLQYNTELGKHMTQCSPIDVKQIVDNTSLLEVQDDLESLGIRTKDPIARIFVVLDGTLIAHAEGAVEPIVFGPGAVVGEAILLGGYVWEFSVKRATDHVIDGQPAVILCQFPVDVVLQYIGRKSKDIVDDMIFYWKSMRLWVEVKHFNKQLEEDCFQKLAAKALDGTAADSTQASSSSLSRTPIDLTNTVRVRVYRAGVDIFQQGQLRHFMYIVKQGSATYYRIFPPDKIGTDIVPERVEVANSDHPVGVRDVRGEVVDSEGGCKGYVLSGDFSFMDSDDIEAIDRIEDLDYKLWKVQQTESSRSVEHHQRKYHRYDKHHNTLTANTRCEVYVVPLRETVKSMAIFRTLIHYSNLKYPELLLNDAQIVANYHERQNWKAIRGEIFQEIKKDVLEKRTASDYHVNVDNNISFELFRSRQPGVLKPTFQKICDAVELSIQSANASTDLAPHEDSIVNQGSESRKAQLSIQIPKRPPELPPKSARSANSAKSSMSSQTAKKEDAEAVSLINMQYVHKLQAVINHYSKHRHTPRTVSPRTGSMDSADFSSTCEAKPIAAERNPLGRRNATIKIIPNSKQDVYFQKLQQQEVDKPDENDSDSSEELRETLRITTQQPSPRTARTPALQSTVVIRPSTTGPKGRRAAVISAPKGPSTKNVSDDTSQTNTVAAKRRHGLIAKVSNVHDIVIQSSNLPQFVPVVPTTGPPTRARSAPGHQRRTKIAASDVPSNKIANGDGATTERPFSSSAAPAGNPTNVNNHKVAEFVSLMASKHAFATSEQENQRSPPPPISRALSRSRSIHGNDGFRSDDQDIIGRRKSGLAPDEYVKVVFLTNNFSLRLFVIYCCLFRNLSKDRETTRCSAFLKNLAEHNRSTYEKINLVFYHLNRW